MITARDDGLYTLINGFQYQIVSDCSRERPDVSNARVFIKEKWLVHEIHNDNINVTNFRHHIRIVSDVVGHMVTGRTILQIL